MTVHLVDLEQQTAVSVPVPPPSAADADNTDNVEDGFDENLLNQQDEGPPVAPLDSEIFVHRTTPDADEDLLAEEQALLRQVTNERMNERMRELRK